MDYYIGIDSGGTKTEFILADEQGHVVCRRTDSGCNPLDVGIQAAQNIILTNLKKLVFDAPGKIVSVYAGIAGVNHVDTGLEKLVKNEFPGAAVRIEDDRRIVISGTLGHTNGCGMICGTGSSLSIITDNKPIRQIGGLGYLIDTGGSGFELGQAGLKCAFRYLDGRGEYTVLAELIAKAVGKAPWEGLADIYAGGRPFIASLAHTVFEGMKMGDRVCRRIVEDGAFRLSELTFPAEKYFDGIFPVVMTGGIFTAYPEYAKLVSDRASKRAKMILASVPPVYGALVEAMWQNGRIADGEFRNNFLHNSKTFSCRPHEVYI